MTQSLSEERQTTWKLLIDKAAHIKYKHVCAVIVWKEDLDTVSYYMLFTRKTGEWLGTVKTLDYLNGRL